MTSVSFVLIMCEIFLQRVVQSVLKFLFLLAWKFFHKWRNVYIVSTATVVVHKCLKRNFVFFPAQNYFYFVWTKPSFNFSHPSLFSLFFVSIVFWWSSRSESFSFLFPPSLFKASSMFSDRFFMCLSNDSYGGHIDNIWIQTDLCHLPNDPGDGTWMYITLYDNMCWTYLRWFFRNSGSFYCRS